MKSQAANRQNRQLQTKYGITKAQYEMILEAQNGVCALCGQPEKQKQLGKIQPLSVDHNHKTHRIRALLCHNCNRSLGGFKDDLEILRKAIKYLEKHK